MDLNGNPVSTSMKVVLGSILAGVLLFFTGMFFLGKSRARKNVMKKIAEEIVEKNIQPTEQDLVKEFKILELDTEDAKKILGMVTEIRKEKAEKAKEDSKPNEQAKENPTKLEADKVAQQAGNLQNDTIVAAS